MADTTQQNNSEPVSNSYLIKKGDTLSAIAKTQGTTIAEIMKLNPSITNPNLIYAGKSLTLPTLGGGVNSSMDYSGVNSVQDANTAINQNQDADIANAEKSSEPTVKSGYDVNGNLAVPTEVKKTTLEDVKSAITPTTAKPTTISLTDKYGALRTEYGVSNLETQLNDLNAQLAEVQAIKKARIASEKGKTVATNVISGRISEVEAQENERITALENSINNVSNQLNTKYNIINTMMTLTEKDYDNTVASYDKEMSNNISMYNILRGINEEEKSAEEAKIDNARASAQIIYNSITSGNVDMKDLPENTKTLISKLEVQAGLPVGFYSTLKQNVGKADVVATYNWTGTDNKEYASVITKDPDTGELKTTNMVLGVAKKTSSTQKTEEDKLKEEQQKVLDSFYKDLKENRDYLEGYGQDRSIAKNTREWLRDLLIRKYPALDEQSIQDEVYAYYPDIKPK
jgi:hypothetical protein